MYFISAQPDTIYFKWQLEVQLLNFKQVGIPPENIHVLLGYAPGFGKDAKLMELAEEQKENARFFFYADERVVSGYAPSIRPHIIKKHFQDHPWLKDECIFYHDSDIIFRELPDFERLCAGDTWYVSDTKRYLDASYIKSICNAIFYEMCEVLQIDRSIILNNDEHAGGAQYVLKGLNYQFWDKVEHDCEKLYWYLNENRERYAQMYCEATGKNRGEYHAFQSWCTDMWVIFWNALSLGYEVKIDKELDFCWPYHTLDAWEETKILHNAGIVDIMGEQFFYKGAYHNNDPYDVNFDTILKDRCTIKYVELIQQFKALRRIDCMDCTFIVVLDNRSQDEMTNVLTTLQFIHKHIKTHILLAEIGEQELLDESQLPPCVRKFFFCDEPHKPKYNNIMMEKAQTPFVSLYDPDVIFNPAQLEASLQQLRLGKTVIVYPYEKKCVAAWDPSLKPFFVKKLDVRMFANAIHVENNNSFGGAVFLNREVYRQCGMDNEHIAAGVVADMERAKRMMILGYQHQRMPGSLYHLSYQRDINYNSNNGAQLESSMDEYLRICNLSKQELTNEIANWHSSTAHTQPAF